MRRRTLMAGALVAGIFMVRARLGFAQEESGSATPAAIGEVTQTAMHSGYAPVNGLQLYYESHGDGGVPLVVLHGAFMSTGMMWPMVSTLAASRRVIAADLQGHGRTADIDRPLRFDQLADDVAALIDYLGLGQADLFGYSKGGQVALRLAMRRAELVRKLVVVSTPFASDAVHPEVRAGIAALTPEMLAGTPFYEDYIRVAPHPDDFPTLAAKMKTLDTEPFAWSPAEIRAIVAPTLVVIGDADIVPPEHAVELFELRGRGVPGDLVGLPAARLAVLPGTTHVGVMARYEWLAPMVAEFLDVPLSEGQ
jgi:pimeloyl-ACP methyl ester carboxylesterase